MFTKILTVFGIVVVVSLCYLFMIVVVPLLADMAVTANTTMDATSNMSNYVGLSGAILGAPLFLYFVPAVAGIILIVMVLRKRAVV